MGMNPPEAWLVWQLVDSAFPTGGFAHSGGLEAAWQHGEIRNRGELRGWLETSLQQIARASVPFVNAAHSEPERLEELDQICDAFTSNHVANRASRLQGRAFLAAVDRVFDQQRSALVFGHLAPVFGATTRDLGMCHDEAVRLFVFLHLRGAVGAAIRLNIIGPMEGQATQHQLTRRAERAVECGRSLTLDDLAQTAPLLEMWQSSQDRLYSRLFQS
jgi:urease accessory protein